MPCVSQHRIAQRVHLSERVHVRPQIRQVAVSRRKHQLHGWIILRQASLILALELQSLIYPCPRLGQVFLAIPCCPNNNRQPCAKALSVAVGIMCQGIAYGCCVRHCLGRVVIGIMCQGIARGVRHYVPRHCLGQLRSALPKAHACGIMRQGVAFGIMCQGTA